LAAGYVSVTPMLLDLTADPYRRPAPERDRTVRALLDKLADWR